MMRRTLFYLAFLLTILGILAGGARAESPNWSDAGYLVCARQNVTMQAGSLPPLAVCVSTSRTIACARAAHSPRCGPLPADGTVLVAIDARLTTEEQQRLVDGGTVTVTGFAIRNQAPARSAVSAPIVLGRAQAPDVVKVRGFGLLP